MSIEARGKKVIAQGCLTNSKHPDRFSVFVPPYVMEGYGEYLIEEDGTKWIDYVAGLGSCHFGYGIEKIANEQIKHIYKGGCHSLPTHAEVIASEGLQTIFPWVEKIKWVNDGSSACTAACEISRAYTGRDWIATEGYHGWHPEQINPIAFKKHPNIFKIVDDPDDLKSWDNLAAIIIEPVMLDNSRKRIDYLKKLRDKCNKTGTLLIFDEVITGLRYPKFGVSNNYGIKPDILLLGKAIGNGEKIAAICGNRQIMDCDYFCSGTYHGHYMSLITANHCFYLAKHDREFDLDRLNNESLRFIESLNHLAEGIFQLKGWGCRASFEGEYALYHQEMAKAKALFGPSLFINFANVKHLDDILTISKHVIRRIRDGKVELVGKAPTPAFSQKARR